MKKVYKYNIGSGERFVGIFSGNSLKEIIEKAQLSQYLYVEWALHAFPLWYIK